jgi:hypothetical integral membrane protein (TIGR02206 family)
MYSAVISPFSPIWWGCFLCTLSLMGVSLFIFRKISLPYKEKVCEYLSFFLFFDLLFHQFLIENAGLWNFRTSLPLHFCNLLELIAAVALCTHWRWFFETSYLLGVIAPFQAILTPAFALPPEGYHFFAFFLGHAAVVMAPLFLAFGLKICLRKGAFWKIPLSFLPIVVVVYIFDWFCGANYMYLCENPPLSHPLNNCSWPFYIFIWTALFFGVSFLLSKFLTWVFTCER